MIARAAAIALAALLAFQDGPPDAKRVDDAVAATVKALRSLQRADGSWILTLPPPGQAPLDGLQPSTLGATAAAAWALTWCELAPDDPALARSLAWIVKNAPLGTGEHGFDACTYEISLVACALSEALLRHDKSKLPVGCRSVLQAAADYLVAAQQPTGGWSYAKTAEPSSHDHSNSQFAMMGLRAAMNAGIKVPALTWERELTHWKTAQLKDGGWNYATCYAAPAQRAAASEASMTAAGVYALAAGLAGVTGKGDPESLLKDAALRKGLESLATHHKVTTGEGDHYWLLGLERGCLATGTEKLGGSDWWSKGARVLLASQGNDGLWRRTRYGFVDQAFALLFLKRARVDLVDPSGQRGRPRERE